MGKNNGYVYQDISDESKKYLAKHSEQKKEFLLKSKVYVHKYKPHSTWALSDDSPVLKDITKLKFVGFSD